MVDREITSTSTSTTAPESRARWRRTLLSWGSLALALAESACVAAVGLSGVRVLLGASSLIAATAGGPAQGFHRSGLRIPFLVAGTIGALVSLLLVWNEAKIRRNPSAAWRVQPLTIQQKRRRRLQVVLAVLTLVLVGLEIVTHPRFHHEM